MRPRATTGLTLLPCYRHNIANNGSGSIHRAPHDLRGATTRTRSAVCSDWTAHVQSSPALVPTDVVPSNYACVLQDKQVCKPEHLQACGRSVRRPHGHGPVLPAICMQASSAPCQKGLQQAWGQSQVCEKGKLTGQEGLRGRPAGGGQHSLSAEEQGFALAQCWSQWSAIRLHGRHVPLVLLACTGRDGLHAALL